MAIRIMQDGKIECDQCKKVLATIRASRQVFDALNAPTFEGKPPECERFCIVTCLDCIAKPIQATPEELEEAARRTDS